MKGTPAFVLLFFLQEACRNPAGTGPAPPDSIPAAFSKGAVPFPNREAVLNHIVLEKGAGLQITSAFLADEKGTLIPTGNTVRTGQPVFLTLRISKGWTVENGYRSPGAVQSIVTHNNEPVLQSRDLYANRLRIKWEDAGTLRLQALFTATRSGIPSYPIRFRVWDKKGNGEMTGHYGLRVEE